MLPKFLVKKTAEKNYIESSTHLIPKGAIQFVEVYAVEFDRPH